MVHSAYYSVSFAIILLISQLSGRPLKVIVKTET
nr:MAG TPA: hypothetical protein [Caudoviricetes sp.]